jgi:hypothetical protein
MVNWIKFDGSEEHKNLMRANDCKIRLKKGGEVDRALFDDIDSFLICEPHPHRDMIIEWANTGRPVFQKNANKWLPDPFPTWSKDAEYSFDLPKEKIRYRVALMEDKYGDAYTETANSEVKEVRIESNEHFIKWITDWIEVDA